MNTGSEMCGRARRLLWHEDGPRAGTPEVLEAQIHLAECPACRQFAGEMRRLRTAVHETAPREQAPVEVRTRLFNAVARARAGSGETARRPGWISRRVWLTAAGLLIVGLAGAFGLSRAWRAGLDPVMAMAEQHAQTLGARQIESPDAAAISAWLSERLDFAMLVPELPDTRLRGARIFVAGGRRGAAVEYDAGGTALSYFVLPDPNGTAGPANMAPPDFAFALHAGYRIVWWREPGLIHAMIADMPPTRLAALAKSCVEQAQRMTAWNIGGIPPQLLLEG